MKVPNDLKADPIERRACVSSGSALQEIATLKKCFGEPSNSEPEATRVAPLGPSRLGAEPAGVPERDL